MAGLGGGVIIKPVLDLIGIDSIASISILSSATVFSMAAVSTARQLHAGFRPQKRMMLLAAGAVLGGLAGSRLFTVISADISPQSLKGAQALFLAGLLVIVLFKNRLPDFDIKNTVVSTLLGIMLGAIAAFLGIGGGPINVAILCMFLAMSIKDAAIISLFIILFSQGAKLTLVAVDTGFGVYEGLDKLLFMIPGGIIGGLIGAKLNRKLSELFIHRFFMVMVFGIICLNLYNAVNALLH